MSLRGRDTRAHKTCPRSVAIASVAIRLHAYNAVFSLMKPGMRGDLVIGAWRMIPPILPGTEAERLDRALEADILMK
jgi:hypothetical protein